MDACAAFGWFQPLNRRPRRNRRSPALRAAFQEKSISPANFVYPLFIHEGWCWTIFFSLLLFELQIMNLLPVNIVTYFSPLSISPTNKCEPVYSQTRCFCLILLEIPGEEDTPIGAMPGCYRLGWRHGLVEEVSNLN